MLSAILVVAFFGFGLFYGRGTHLTIADYWRWFVVHIWVESIFEFFGVAVISLFLVTLGLVSAKSALRVAYLTAILVFISGIPGTAHHYFWYGGPSFWLAIGGVFSSLEPIPLILLVVRAWMEYKSIKAEGREFPYRWPLYFLTASSVWNFVGAGMFGFLINLPIVNYYEHATYLTANHAHTALFGVYGMLAIALILFSWRGLVENEVLERRDSQAELLGTERGAVPDVHHRAVADWPDASLVQLRPGVLVRPQRRVLREGVGSDLGQLAGCARHDHHRPRRFPAALLPAEHVPTLTLGGGDRGSEYGVIGSDRRVATRQAAGETKPLGVCRRRASSGMQRGASGAVA